MTRARRHRRGGAAGFATARTGGIHRGPGTRAPRTAGAPPAARAPRPEAARAPQPEAVKAKGLLSALVLLAALLLAVSTAGAAYDPEVEAVQRALTERGYDPGTIDGAMGWRTRGALRKFQRAVGILDTGRIDDATRTALGLTSRDGTKRPPAEDADSAGTGDTGRTEPAAEPEAAAPKADPARTELVIVPETDASKAEPAGDEPAAMPEAAAPEADPARTEFVIAPEADASRTEPTGAEPAAVPETAAPEVETVRTELVIVPEADASKAEPAGAESAAVPETAAPKADPVRTEIVIAPEADASGTEPAGAEPAAVPEAAAPEVETVRTKPAAAPESAAPITETARTDPAADPQTPVRTTEAARAESTPVRASLPKLDYATLGWHRPQTGAEARARFDAIGAPPEFRRGKGALFVPKGEFVFVLEAGERFPGLDCDPGAGRLSIEFVFGPDGPVIFTPSGDGALCQAGIGIAVEVGRTLEIRRVDWGDTQLPPGTVRVTGQGLEYVK